MISIERLTYNLRLKKLIVRVGDEGAEFYSRDIQKLSESILESYP